ncbi:uncharacterized protein [Ptychodera flava]|uniref:uncharacterized protein n=1 Tax=Ptychodera flava TaxID=63121 RepID=UPI00396A6212
MAKRLCQQIRDVSQDRILDVFRRLMNIHGATAVYLATPLPYHSDFVRGLQSSMPNFFTLEHLLAMKNSRLMGLDEDNYKASLVEQEICKESTVFLGLSTHSSWSGMVAEDRNDRDVYEITTEFGLATD